MRSTMVATSSSMRFMLACCSTMKSRCLISFSRLGALAHFALEAIRLHVHLHIRPKHVKLHFLPPIHMSKRLKTAFKDVYIIL